MPAVIDLTGQRFGLWLVLRRASSDRHGLFWWCRCACGSHRAVWSQNLRSGRTRSCGCSHNRHHLRHGLSRTVEYKAAQRARARCRNQLHPRYHDWGGRGIEYHLPDDPGEAALLLVAAIGPRPPGMSLDRIDNDGHYEIGNLRWATTVEQLGNRRQAKNKGVRR